MASSPKNALIVGASRGLGLGLVEVLLKRGWRVTATQREPSGLDKHTSDALAIETVDIDDRDSVSALRSRLASHTFDLIFVVAGVLSHRDEPISDVPDEALARTYLTNAVSPIRFADAFAEQITAKGLIVFMSSVLGSVTLNDSGGTENYRASKVALNTNARSFAARYRDADFGVLLMHPGWVRTEMGGANAAIDVSTSVAGMADVIEGRFGEKGTAFLDYTGKTLPW